MSATLTKKFNIGILMAFVMSLLFAFGTPILSHANDIGSVGVTVTSDGKLTISGESAFKDGASTSAWNDLIKKYRKFIVGISGIGAVSMIAFFIVQFMKLGASAGNPQARSQALGGVLWTGMAAAGLGAVTVIVGFFYNSIG
jgi:Type IV secretion system pilin